MSSKKIKLDLMSNENILTRTKFGIVTNKRVIYYSGMRWFKSGSRTDIPLQHITSVGYDIKRSFFKGLGLIIIGVPLSVLLIGLFLMVKGIFYLTGYPVITINTSGQDKSEMTGNPNLKLDAEKFVVALRNVIFSRQHEQS